MENNCVEEGFLSDKGQLIRMGRIRSVSLQMPDMKLLLMELPQIS